MAPFAGYNMPIQYIGVNKEHHAVRNAVGVFDVSHMGEFVLKGPNALDLIQKISSNDASKLVPGKAQYSCMPNAQGGIVDDLLVYMLDEEHYLLVVNASNIEKDWNWIKSQDEWNVDMQDVSDDMALLAVQGPKAVETVARLTDTDVAALKFYTFTHGTVAGVPDVLISATGYTGAGGFELYIPAAEAGKVWDAVLEAGAEFDIQPAGLAARDTLRLEKGYCLYGNDITDETSPLEAGLGWITKLKKEADFVSKSQLAAQKEQGVSRRLIGFEMVITGIPRQGYDLEDANENKIGFVTSGTMSPTLGKGIGLGYVSKDFTHEGAVIKVAIRNKKVSAKVVKLPFVG